VLLAALQEDEAPGQQQQQQQPGQQSSAAAAAADASARPAGSVSSVSSSKTVKVVDYLNEAYERACQYVKRSGLEGQEQLQALQVGAFCRVCSAEVRYYAVERMCGCASCHTLLFNLVAMGVPHRSLCAVQLSSRTVQLSC
jgi:hypothetical protein